MIAEIGFSTDINKKRIILFGPKKQRQNIFNICLKSIFTPLIEPMPIFKIFVEIKCAEKCPIQNKIVLKSPHFQDHVFFTKLHFNSIFREETLPLFKKTPEL